MKDACFAAIMGVPNATGIWQWADMYNNGVLKIKVVLAKRYLLQLKASDFAKPEAERRIPKGTLHPFTATPTARTHTTTRRPTPVPVLQGNITGS